MCCASAFYCIFPAALCYFDGSTIYATIMQGIIVFLKMIIHHIEAMFLLSCNAF